jgi:hypothetical protein
VSDAKIRRLSNRLEMARRGGDDERVEVLLAQLEALGVPRPAPEAESRRKSHRWCALMGYEVPEEDIVRSMETGLAIALTDGRRILGPDYACIDCGEPFWTDPYNRNTDACAGLPPEDLPPEPVAEESADNPNRLGLSSGDGVVDDAPEAV